MSLRAMRFRSVLVMRCHHHVPSTRNFSQAAAAVERGEVSSSSSSLSSATFTSALLPEDSLVTLYDERCRRGALREDGDQRSAIARMEDLRLDLKAYARDMAVYAEELRKWNEERDQRMQTASAQGSSSDATQEPRHHHHYHEQQQLQRQDVGKNTDQTKLRPAPVRPATPRGLFIHGSVGTGKTMLMDLFAGAVDADFAEREREKGGSDESSHTQYCAIANNKSNYNTTSTAAASTITTNNYSALPGTVRRVHFHTFLMECHKRIWSHQRAAIASASNVTSDAPSAIEFAPGFRLSIMEQLVRRFVRDKRDERAESQRRLGEALDSISSDILSGDIAPGEAATKVMAPRQPSSTSSSSTLDATTAEEQLSQPSQSLLLDEHGRPVSFGLLAFDEMQLMDVADATVVTGVLSRLAEAGWVLVATSNRSPEALADTIVHRQHPQARFADSIAALCEEMKVCGGTRALDYRATFTPNPDPQYFYPLDDSKAVADFEAAYATIVTASSSAAAAAAAAAAANGGSDGGSDGGASAVACVAGPHKFSLGPGRSLPINGVPGAVARLDFDDLCGAALGPADYIALGEAYHTLALTGVPELTFKSRDRARRFISLIDALYDKRVQLLLQSDVPASELFRGGADMAAPELDISTLEGMEFEGEAGKTEALNPIGITANVRAALTGGAGAKVGADSRKELVRDSLFTGQDESFAFRRAASRLQEMASVEYLAQREKP